MLPNRSESHSVGCVAMRCWFVFASVPCLDTQCNSTGAQVGVPVCVEYV